MKNASVLFSLLLVMLFVFAGCEGPMGPEGPEGPAGEQGPEGEEGSQDPEGEDFDFGQGEAGVSTAGGLKAALNNDEIGYIQFAEDITMFDDVQLEAPKEINLDGHTWAGEDGVDIEVGFDGQAIKLEGSNVKNVNVNGGSESLIILGDTVELDNVAYDNTYIRGTLSGDFTLEDDAVLDSATALVDLDEITVNNHSQLAAALESEIPEITFGSDIDISDIDDVDEGRLEQEAAATILGDGKSFVADGDNKVSVSFGDGHDLTLKNVTFDTDSTHTVAEDTVTFEDVTSKDELRIAEDVTLTIDGRLTANNAISAQDGTATIDGDGTLVLDNATADLDGLVLDVDVDVDESVAFTDVTSRGVVEIERNVTVTIENTLTAENEIIGLPVGTDQSTIDGDTLELRAGGDLTDLELEDVDVKVDAAITFNSVVLNEYTLTYIDNGITLTFGGGGISESNTVDDGAVIFGDNDSALDGAPNVQDAALIARLVLDADGGDDGQIRVYPGEEWDNEETVFLAASIGFLEDVGEDDINAIDSEEDVDYDDSFGHLSFDLDTEQIGESDAIVIDVEIGAAESETLFVSREKDYDGDGGIDYYRNYW